MVTSLLLYAYKISTRFAKVLLLFILSTKIDSWWHCFKWFSSPICGLISTKIFLVAPDMCDYQRVSQVFVVDTLISLGNVRLGPILGYFLERRFRENLAYSCEVSSLNYLKTKLQLWEVKYKMLAVLIVNINKMRLKS